MLNDVLLANINSNDYDDITGPVNSKLKDLAQIQAGTNILLTRYGF